MGKLPSGNLTLCHEAVARVSGRRRGAGGRTHPSQFCCGGRRRDPHCGPRSQCHRQRSGPVGRDHGLSAWPARPAQARKPRPRGRLHPRSPPHCVSSVAHASCAPRHNLCTSSSSWWGRQGRDSRARPHRVPSVGRQSVLDSEACGQVRPNRDSLRTARQSQPGPPFPTRRFQVVLGLPGVIGVTGV